MQYNRNLEYEMQLDEAGDRRHTYPYDFKVCHIKGVSASLPYMFDSPPPQSLINIGKSTEQNEKLQIAKRTVGVYKTPAGLWSEQSLCLC